MPAEALSEVQRLINRQDGIALIDSRTILPKSGLQVPLYRGKVRDSFDLGDKLLIVTTDRISTFDAVHPNGVPGKGIILNQMSLGFFELTGPVVPNHVITADTNQFPEPFNSLDQLEGRAVLVHKLEMLPAECIVRGYLTGSGWASYKKTGQVCGINLTEGLLESQQLNPPIFTPSTKAEAGQHDENISLNQMREILEQRAQAQMVPELAELLKQISVDVYQTAAEYALARKIIIADTKLEFGLDKNGFLVLADEVLTPDSSRFWPAEAYAPGRSQPSFDKQYVRDWAASTGWNKEPPAPTLPEEVVAQTAEKYIEAYHRLFG